MDMARGMGQRISSSSIINDFPLRSDEKEPVVGKMVSEYRRN